MMQEAFGTGFKLLLREDLVEAAEWRNFRQRPSPENRAKLFDRYMPFARLVAHSEWRKFGRSGFEAGDAEQLAFEALLESIERFNPERGVPFKVFVRRRLKGAISNERQRSSEAAALAGYRARVQRDRIRSLRASPEAALDDPIGQLRELAVGIAIGLLLESEAKSEVANVPDREPSAYDELVWRQMLSDLRNRMSQLPERERLVLEYHYGRDVMFKEIAELLGLSKGRVSQLHAQALQRLRRALHKFT